MKYAKAYLRDFVKVFSMFSTLFMLNRLFMLNELAIYFCFCTVIVALAGPIRVYIEEKIKQ